MANGIETGVRGGELGASQEPKKSQEEHSFERCVCVVIDVAGAEDVDASG